MYFFPNFQIAYLGVFFGAHCSFCMRYKMKMVTGDLLNLLIFKLGWVIGASYAENLTFCKKWLIYLCFIFQLYFQVSQHKHQDNIHSSVQWKERKTGGPGVPSEACATPDLSLNNKHSRQHGSPDQPSPFSHRNYQVFKPCALHMGQCMVSNMRQLSNSF